MPPILNSSAQLTCCHSGPVTLVPKQTQVLIGGTPALCMGDVVASPTACPVPPSPGSKPCTTSTVTPIPGVTVSMKVKVMGKPVILGNPTLTGITDGVPPCPMLMVVSPGQMTVIATG